jgi:hypothetical protein
MEEPKVIYTSGTNVKKVVAATYYSTGRDGLEYPSRYVVLEWGDGNYQRYSRHMQVDNGKDKDYFIYGHYYDRYADAFEDMVKSMNENDRSYLLGNISHMGGVDFVKE